MPSGGLSDNVGRKTASDCYGLTDAQNCEELLIPDCLAAHKSTLNVVFDAFGYIL